MIRSNRKCTTTSAAISLPGCIRFNVCYVYVRNDEPRSNPASESGPLQPRSGSLHLRRSLRRYTSDSYLRRPYAPGRLALGGSRDIRRGRLFAGWFPPSANPDACAVGPHVPCSFSDGGIIGEFGITPSRFSSRGSSANSSLRNFSTRFAVTRVLDLMEEHAETPEICESPLSEWQESERCEGERRISPFPVPWLVSISHISPSSSPSAFASPQAAQTFSSSRIFSRKSKTFSFEAKLATRFAPSFCPGGCWE